MGKSFRKIAVAVVATVTVLVGLTGSASAQIVTVTNPVIQQRADSAVIKHTDGYYYMTASVPDYKRVELRRSTTLQGLGSAATSTAFTAAASGTLSGWLWAPDIRFYDGAWYIYFSGSPSTAPYDQRIYWIRNTSANPMTGTWSAPVRFTTQWDNFTLDPASFELNGVRYFTWAQKNPSSTDNSQVFIARMSSPTAITGTPVAIAAPTYAWEREGVAVAEGPQVVIKNGRVFLAYSVSATDSRYKLGLLTASTTANLLSASSWTKSATAVFQTANAVYGPGHGSFTVAEDGKTDILVYHARDYATPTPDALRDPNRHTRMQQLYWKDDGTPFFGQPVANGVSPDRHPRVVQQQVRRQLRRQHDAGRAGQAVLLHWRGGPAVRLRLPGQQLLPHHQQEHRHLPGQRERQHRPERGRRPLHLQRCHRPAVGHPRPRQRLVPAVQRGRQDVPGQLRVERRQRRPPLALHLQHRDRPDVAPRLRLVSR